MLPKVAVEPQMKPKVPASEYRAGAGPKPEGCGAFGIVSRRSGASRSRHLADRGDVWMLVGFPTCSSEPFERVGIRNSVPLDRGRFGHDRGDRCRFWPYCKRAAFPRIIAALLMALVFAVSGCVTLPGIHTGITWGECPESMAAEIARQTPGLAGRVQLSCGGLEVPLDHARPDGERIALSIVRARLAGQSQRIGSLIYNPGGPGASGLDYLPATLAMLPEIVLQRFDVVSMDPRGTGGSAPFNCPKAPQVPPGEVAPDVLTDAGLAAAAQLDRQYAEGCLRVLGDRAPFFSTEATAQDLDLLRAAVGDEKLTYLGMSYGAKLGAEYARRFPGSVRAAVLDGPSEPSETLSESLARQAQGFENTFDEYARGCPSRPECQLGKNPRAFVQSLVARADAEPIPSSSKADMGPATGSDMLRTVRGGLYSTDRWFDLDEVLYDASKGDAHGIFAMGRVVNWQEEDDSAPSDPTDANYVINCNDSVVGPSDDQVRETARQLALAAPLFGKDTAANLLVCAGWQPHRSVLAPPAAPTPNPVLVIGTVHDPATPYVGAVALTRAMGNAMLLTWEGTNHTALTFSSCIANHAARYLIELSLPQERTRCPQA